MAPSDQTRREGFKIGHLGYIKLHREILDKPLFANPDLFRVWIWCLLKASHKEYELYVGHQKIKVLAGQFITGREAGSLELGMSQSAFWRHLHTLKTNGSADIKSNNKFSVVTVANWALYQSDDAKVDSKMDNKKTSNGQPADTNKNVKNDKKVISLLHKEIVEIYHLSCPSLAKVSKLTDKRIKALDARLRDCETKDTFQTLFVRAESSHFLTGGNDRGWKADFDWLLNPTNWAKVMEGKYDNRKGGGMQCGQPPKPDKAREFIE